jgi:hypothetical protein
MVTIVGVVALVDTANALIGEMLQQTWLLGDLTLRTTTPDALAAPLAPLTCVRLTVYVAALTGDALAAELELVPLLELPQPASPSSNVMPIATNPPRTPLNLIAAPRSVLQFMNHMPCAGCDPHQKGRACTSTRPAGRPAGTYRSARHTAALGTVLATASFRRGLRYFTRGQGLVRASLNRAWPLHRPAPN